MARMNTPHGVRTASAQAAAFHARERTRSLRDPAAGLFVTHRFALGSLIDESAVFPSATAPFTFAVDVRATSTSLNGIVFEIGNDTNGTVFLLDSTNGRVGLGSGGPRNEDFGATAYWTGLDFNKGAAGPLHRFVGAVNPGRGVVNLWHNGELVAAAKSIGGAFLLFDSDGGAVGASEGSVSNRAGTDALVALAGGTLVGPLRVFYRQLPRQMLNSGLGVDETGGTWSN